MHYLRRRDARIHGKKMLIVVTLAILAMTAVAIWIFSGGPNSERAPVAFQVAFFSIVTLCYAFFLYACLRYIRHGGEWRWEITDDSIILNAPFPSEGPIGVIPLKDVCSIHRETSGGFPVGYSLIDRDGRTWPLSDNYCGFDPAAFVREIQSRRPIPLIE